MDIRNNERGNAKKQGRKRPVPPEGNGGTATQTDIGDENDGQRTAGG
jgi:hypothetical protein